MREVTMYEADDGSKYATKQEAEDRDAFIDLVKEVEHLWYYGERNLDLLNHIWRNYRLEKK